MPAWLTIVLTTLAGLIIGAFGFVALSVMYWRLIIRPPAAVDTATFPQMVAFYQGAILGMGSGLAVGLDWSGRRVPAGWVCIGFGALAIVTVLLFMGTAFGGAGETPQEPAWRRILGALTFLAFEALTLMWAIVLIWKGILLR